MHNNEGTYDCFWELIINTEDVVKTKGNLLDWYNKFKDVDDFFIDADDYTGTEWSIASDLIGVDKHELLDKFINLKIRCAESNSNEDFGYLNKYEFNSLLLDIKEFGFDINKYDNKYDNKYSNINRVLREIETRKTLLDVL